MTVVNRFNSKGVLTVHTEHLGDTTTETVTIGGYGTTQFQQYTNAGNHVSPTQYSMTKVETSCMLGSINESWTTSGRAQWVRDSGALGFIPDGTAIPASQWDAYNACISDLNGIARGNCDLAVDLVQGHQAFDMIRSYTPKRIIGRVGNLIGHVRKVEREAKILKKRLDAVSRQTTKAGYRARQLKKLEKKRPRRKSSRNGINQTNAIAQEWLAWTYGMRPTLQDIHESALGILDSSSKDTFYPIKARASRTEKDVVSKVLVAPSGQWKGSVLQVTNRKVCNRYEICLWIGNLSKQATIAKFTSLNPASLAWECIPYSFVVDWFADIGGYLRNLETGLAYASAFSSGYSTWTRLIENSTRVLGDQFDTSRQGHSKITRASGTYRNIYQLRSPLTSYPLPRPPVVKCDLGSGRLLNAAALLGSLLKRR